MGIEIGGFEISSTSQAEVLQIQGLISDSELQEALQRLGKYTEINLIAQAIRLDKVQGVAPLKILIREIRGH